MKTLFLYNKEIVYSTEFNLYQNELEQLVKHIASTIYVEPQEIELHYEEIEIKKEIELSKVCVTSGGDFIFDSGNYQFGVNLMEGKLITGIRLAVNHDSIDELADVLDNIVDNKADENLQFTI